jgi:hypothetical protein
MGIDEIKSGGRRRSKMTKKNAGRRHRKTAKRGGFVGDALLAAAAVGAAVYGRKMTRKGGKRMIPPRSMKNRGAR